MKFFTADTHFNHKNVIPYCARPFSDVLDMERGLIRRWNEVVRAEDDVYVLGDFSFAGVHVTSAILAELKGRKHLIRGNHDDIRSEEKALRIGFSSFAKEGGVVIGGEFFKLSHYPYYGDSTEQDRYVERRPVDEGGWLLHGHVHREWVTRDKMINVGVDVWNLAPVGEDMILKMRRHLEGEMPKKFVEVGHE